MDTRSSCTEPQNVRVRTPTLKEQLAQSASGAALASRNKDLNELDRLAEGQDPPEEDEKEI